MPIGEVGVQAWLDQSRLKSQAWTSLRDMPIGASRRTGAVERAIPASIELLIGCLPATAAPWASRTNPYPSSVCAAPCTGLAIPRHVPDFRTWEAQPFDSGRLFIALIFFESNAFFLFALI